MSIRYTQKYTSDIGMSIRHTQQTEDGHIGMSIRYTPQTHTADTEMRARYTQYTYRNQDEVHSIGIYCEYLKNPRRGDQRLKRTDDEMMRSRDRKSRELKQACNEVSTARPQGGSVREPCCAPALINRLITYSIN